MVPTGTGGPEYTFDRPLQVQRASSHTYDTPPRQRGVRITLPAPRFRGGGFLHRIKRTFTHNLFRRIDIRDARMNHEAGSVRQRHANMKSSVEPPPSHRL